MGKIRLNLVSGAVVEKPLINAFKANNSCYVVFDNEMNGSMGLPIILVCKLENNRLTKIIDQNEWQIVKEYLKNIIAGNQIEFIKIDSELSADDIYYTQLTLPVPSFDALKTAYKVEENIISGENILNFNQEPVQVVMTSEVQPEMPAVSSEPVASVVQTETAPVNVELQNIPEVPVVDINIPNENVNVISNNQNTTPMIDLEAPVVTFGENINPTEIVPPVTEVVSQQVEASPVMENVVSNETSMFREQKEAFMLACENMFDALVQKFEKELENRK